MKKANYLKTIFLLWGLIAGIGSVSADDFAYEWVKVTDLSKVETGDLVVLAYGNLALRNDELNGVFAVPVTISDGIILDEDVAENIQWTLTKQENDEGTYYSFAIKTGRLLGIDHEDNNSVVVGPTDPNTSITEFSFKDYGDNGGVLHSNGNYYIKLASNTNKAVVDRNSGSNFTLYKRTVKNYVKWERVNDTNVILEPNDSVVIVDLATGRAMSNDKGTKDPDAVAVDLNDDKDRILGDVAEKVKWAFTSNGGYKFAFGENNLYATSDGLRVGTETTNNEFGFSYNDVNGNYMSITIDNTQYFAVVEESMFSNGWKLVKEDDDKAKDGQIAIFKKVVDPIKKVTIELAEYYNYDLNEGYAYVAYDFEDKVTITGADKSEIQWSSSNPAVATINENGFLTLKKRGTTVITATVALSEYHDKASTKCTLIVDDSSTADLGTLALPLTVAEAKQLAETGKVEHDGTVYLTREEGVNYYVKGKVSKVNSGLMAMFGDMDMGSIGGSGGSGGMDFDDMMDDMDFDMDSMGDMGFDMSSLGFDFSSIFGSSDKVTYYISDDGTKDNQMKVVNGCGTVKTNSSYGIEFNEIPKLSPGDCVVVCGPIVYTEDTSMFSSLMGGSSSEEPKKSGKVDELNYLAIYDPTLLITEQEQEVYVNKTLDGSVSKPLNGNSLYTIDNEFNLYNNYNNEVKITSDMKVEAPTYKSSDEDIAKWDEDSKTIVGVSEGTAKITVKVKVIVQEADDTADPKVEEKSYTMKRKFKLTVLTRDVEPAGKYAGDYVLTTKASDLKDGTRLVLVGTRVKDDNETDYVMGENNSMMGGGKSGSKYEFSDTNKEKIPCEDVPKGTIEVVLEKEGDSWYLNVGKDENGEKLYLYASDTSEDKEEETPEGEGNKFDFSKMMEMFMPSSGLKVATKEAVSADSCKATISIAGNIATIKYTKTEGKNNTIMLASAFDMDSMMSMFGGNGEGEGDEGGTGTSTSTFDMGSFDMFMASFNSKKADDEKGFMPRIYRYVPDESFGISIGDTGWSTIVTYNDVTIPDNLEAYVVTKVKDADTEKTAILQYVEGLKGGHPYLLHSETPGDFTLTLSDAVTEPTTNLLQVSNAKTDNGVYVLAKKDGEVAFYVWNGGLLGSGRVYLPAESGASLARILIDFYDEPVGIATGITDVKQSSDMKAYDLQGRRVVAPKGQVQKGLYIVNGRKVVIK